MQDKLPFTELKEEYRRYFESKIAVCALLNTELSQYSSLRKISDSIICLLKGNKEEVKAEIVKNPKIKAELYSSELYGHLETENSNNLIPDQIYHQLIETLENKASKASSIIHIHALFIQRIYDHLTIKSVIGASNVVEEKRKSDLADKLFYSELFKDRGRMQITIDPIFVTTAGINRNRFFKNRLKLTIEKHAPGMHRFIPDKQSDVFKKISLAKMPFVAGPSGHMGSLILGAELYGTLNAEQIKEYNFLCAVFLVCGGNHSLFECMSVANQINCFYKLNEYSSFIPESFKKTQNYQRLIEEFPDFLNDAMTASSNASVLNH